MSSPRPLLPSKASGTDAETTNASTTNESVPEVLPPSDQKCEYMDWNLSTTVTGYVARLTTEVRNFCRRLTRTNTVVAGSILADSFLEVSGLEDTYQACKAGLGRQKQNTPDHVKGGDIDGSARDDVSNRDISDNGLSDSHEDDDREEFLDALKVAEAREHAYRGRQRVYRDHLSDREVSSKTRTSPRVHSHMPSIVPGWITDDDGYDTSISSNSDVDWCCNASPDTNTVISSLSYPPTPINPATAALSLVSFENMTVSLAEASRDPPAHIKHARTGIMGLFRDIPVPFFERRRRERLWTWQTRSRRSRPQRVRRKKHLETSTEVKGAFSVRDLTVAIASIAYATYRCRDEDERGHRRAPSATTPLHTWQAFAQHDGIRYLR
ncbi:hypothetical protein WOLCODRAFT_156967 [Wolfiporia cocos MD-104 SS10]|uniref:Uncharacterized protein n=1 Tax=Wolfiporia cocos (strain MD-104) TaxID=742152 RepID=A0A2H3JHT9_WOLCO|nr:hypothetical protein WOLCODRAFT_156967 [Wolfiporia cocos MD-104 SS10]